ncbi:hypothetical protein G6F37_012541 [Rhizopus arrhizus]|nr:hypothetical protein G6F37_012541 [Rhizopus arrhizus]
MAIEDHQGGVPHSICQITQPMAIDENEEGQDPRSKGFLSRFFTLQEATKRRPILDCRKINHCIQVEHFKMEGVPALRDLIEPGDFMVKLDLQDAYTVIPIHPASRPFLVFENQGKLYQYKSLNFGLNVAPRIFSKILRYAIEPLRKQGIRLVYYLDDICILSQDAQELAKTAKRLTYTISRTRISGIRIQHQIDADQGPRSQDPQLDATIETSITTNNEVVSLGGQLTREDHGNVTSGGRSPIAYQTFTEVLIQEPTSTSLQLGKPMPIVPQAIEELQWWQIFLTKKNGLPIHRIQLKKPQITITTDSSDTGWGVNSNFIQTYGFWTAAEKTLSINVRELMGIYFALKLHGPNFRNCTIKVLTDNKTSIKYTTKAGGTASVHLQDYAVKIQDLCNMYNLNVIYQHIKGVDNVEADQLSRTKKPLYESTIPKRFFRTIQSLWGPLDIDMFASRQNTQLPRYWSLRPDPQAMATDAFLQQWPMIGLYAYPPWKLIPPVLRLIKKKRIRRIVLVTPWWPTQFWFRCCWE